MASNWANSVMRKALASNYPDIGWSDLEAQPDLQGPPASDKAYWIYDPIDGAYHYVQSLPLWSASLVLVQAGRTVFSIIYEPSSGDVYVAKEGNGSTLNGVSIHVSGKSDLRSTVMATAIPPFGSVSLEESETAFGLLGAIVRRVFVVRQMASVSLQLAFVAAGKLDGYWEVGRDTHDWAAAALLIREAGGQVKDLAGRDFDLDSNGIVAASPTLLDSLLAALAGAEFQS